MKSSVATLLVILAMSAGAFAAGKGPEIDLVDNKLPSVGLLTQKNIDSLLIWQKISPDPSEELASVD